MDLPNMQKAIDRINQAIHAQEQITVYGDYDVDGVTATSVMLSVLHSLGAKVDFYIPNRTSEGYGLNLKAVSILASTSRHRRTFARYRCRSWRVNSVATTSSPIDAPQIVFRQHAGS